MSLIHRSIWLALGLVVAPLVLAQDAEFFEKKIRPVLVDQCYKCHSTHAEKLKGGLMLDTKAGIDKGGDNGPVLVRGEPDKSKLIEAVRWTNPDLQMPPKKKLSDEQIADLVAWVKAGAPDPRTDGVGGITSTTKPIDLKAAKQWWAFVPPKDPAVPKVKRADWPRNGIDNFVLVKLEEKNISPARQADKRTLIRRATYDLTGLPPTEPEVAAFLADDSPQAFARVVDRLLASPHYGEKWGRHWLDIVRYTDSFDSRGIGGAADVPDAWRYRDWVVNAFNADLPYDQFITQQIAGDLLPGKKGGAFNPDGIIATGMYAIGNWPGGDADKEKMLTDIVDDQVDVTSRAFLAITVACARCHDHKFDPIPTADYYGLAGIFFSTHILPGPGAKTEGSPTLRIPLAAPEEVQKRKDYEAQVAQLNQKMTQLADGYRSKAGVEAMKQIDKYLPAAWELRGKPIVPVARYALEHKLDAKLLKNWVDYLAPTNAPASIRKPLTKPAQSVKKLLGVEGYVGNDLRPTPNVVINKSDKAATLSTVTFPARAVTVHPGPDTNVAAGWKSPIAGRVTLKGKVVDADPNGGDGVLWRLELCSGARPTRALAAGNIENGGMEAFAVPEAVEVKVDDVIQLVIDPKGDYSFDTTHIDLTITGASNTAQSWNLTSNILSGDRETWSFYELAGRRSGIVPPGSSLGEWITKCSNSATPADQIAAALARVQEALAAIQTKVELAAKEGKNAFEGAGALAGPDVQLYKDLVAPRGTFWGMPKTDNSDLPLEAREQIAMMKSTLADMEKRAPAMIPNAEGLQDGGTPNTPYSKIADSRIHIRGRYDRLGETVPRHVPQVLGDEQPYFDAASSGRLQLAQWIASPKNPLTARVLVNRLWQWHFGQGIVRTPSNFGKLGTPPTHPELLDYLAHRFVESGWSIKAMHRMIMLSAAYQQASVPEAPTLKADPDNLLLGHMPRRRLEAEELRDSMLVCTDSLDPTLHGTPVNDLNTKRRTLYLMTVRSDRSGYRAIFDAADPNGITDQRLDSTVAPQALFLMNHPFVNARAESLAKTVQAQGGADDRAKIDWLYHRLFARPAREAEVELGLKAIADGWEAYCQILLCTNEFSYVD
jgi:hypothetical protein